MKYASIQNFAPPLRSNHRDMENFLVEKKNDESNQLTLAQTTDIELKGQSNFLAAFEEKLRIQSAIQKELDDKK